MDQRTEQDTLDSPAITRGGLTQLRLGTPLMRARSCVGPARIPPRRNWLGKGLRPGRRQRTERLKLNVSENRGQSPIPLGALAPSAGRISAPAHSPD